MKRWMCVTDTHGDLIDPASRDAALAFMEVYKPEVRLHLGDAIDMRALRNGASDEEKAEGIEADLDAGIAFLKAYQPTVFMFGNHDYRPVDRAENAVDGVMRGYCRQLVDRLMDEFGAMGTKVYPYDAELGVHRFGGVNWLHGYNANMHAAAMAGRAYGPCFMGHVHTHQVYQLRRHGGGSAVSLPCMMDIRRANYARRRLATLGWVNGFAYGTATEDSLSWNVIMADNRGRYTLPTSFTEI